MSSSERKLINHIDTIENESDKKINNSNYYIVSVIIEKIPLKKLEDIAKKFCRNELPQSKDESWTPPIIVYICNNQIKFLFSTTEESHNFEGSHHKICSIFTSTLTLEFSKSCSTSLVELGNRYLILCYFQCKVYNYSIERMRRLLIRKDQKLSKVKLKTLTLKENLAILEENGINWTKLENKNKYGLFLKLDKDNIFQTLSESLDISKLEDYNTFFFE